MSEHESPAAMPGSVPQPPPAVPPERRAGAALRLCWPVLCLFQLGVFAGIWWTGAGNAPPHAASPHGHSPTPPRGKAETIKADPPGRSNGLLGWADDLFRATRYEQALSYYQKMVERASGRWRVALNYRIAVCQEALGRREEALATYRAVVSQSDDPRLAACAQIGQARIWLRNRQPQEAGALLAPLVLSHADPALRDEPFLADVRYLFALCLAQKTVIAPADGPLGDELAVATVSDLNLRQALAWARQSPPAAATRRADVVRVQEFVTGSGLFFVTAHMQPAPVATLLERIVAEGKLTLKWQGAARQAAEGRTARVDVENMPLDDLALAVLEPLALVARREGSMLHIAREMDVDATALAAQRNAAAARALRDVLQAHPDHPFAAAASLEAGNLEAALGNDLPALAWYERLVKEAPRSAALGAAHYNLGLLHRKLDNPVGAQTAFYRLIDGSPGHELVPLAYLQIGRTLLEQGDYERAVAPLRRGTAASAGSPAQPALALALAGAYLLVQEPQEAHAVLQKHRRPLSNGEFRRSAALLDALARYRIAGTLSRASREGSDLLAALLTYPTPDRVLGPAGTLLAGQAYRELGMPEQMAALFDKARSHAKGPIGEEMTFLLADHWKDTPRRKDATALLEKLAAATTSAWSWPARKSLAELAYREDRLQDCVKLCRELLAAPIGEPHRGSVLELMGKAFERLGDHGRAAQCFAGQVPA